MNLFVASLAFMYIIKNDYIEKSMTILGDTTTFKKLQKILREQEKTDFMLFF